MVAKLRKTFETTKKVEKKNFVQKIIGAAYTLIFANAVSLRYFSPTATWLPNFETS